MLRPDPAVDAPKPEHHAVESVDRKTNALNDRQMSSVRARIDPDGDADAEPADLSCSSRFLPPSVSRIIRNHHHFTTLLESFTSADKNRVSTVFCRSDQNFVESGIWRRVLSQGDRFSRYSLTYPSFCCVDPICICDRLRRFAHLFLDRAIFSDDSE